MSPRNIMLDSKKEKACAQNNYVVHANDLPLSCPTKSMELWSAHPKVYLPIEKTGIEVCPYCGSRFVLQND
jgi:uncharacterized Zn-finger protein